MKDINYSNTKIYKIKKINEDDGKCYIGYTTNINNFINKWNKQYTNYNKEMKQYIDNDMEMYYPHKQECNETTKWKYRNKLIDKEIENELEEELEEYGMEIED